jgi:hypothetical protein
MLRVVGGDEKGSLKFETVKYVQESQRDPDPRKTALAKASSIYKRLVLSSQRAPHKNKTVTANSNKYLVMSPS